MIITQDELKNYPSRYRATMINSLAGVKSVVLVGTQSKSGQRNLAIVNSLIHIGANPPLWGILFRPHTVRRDTLENLLDTHYYSLNLVQTSDYKKAHQTAAKYPQDISEFDACEWDAVYHENFAAPFVRQSPIKIGMKLVERVDIKINDTILIIGSIEHIDCPEALISPDGFIHLGQADTLACAGLDAYYRTEFIDRLAYAKPFEATQSLPKESS